MAEKRQTKQIRHDILLSIFQHGGEIDAAAIAERYHITVQSVYRNIRALEQEDAIDKVQKAGKRQSYALRDVAVFTKSYEVAGLNEDVVFSQDISPRLPAMPPAAREAFAYVFSEMLNNAIDHSESARVTVELYKTALSVGCIIADQGIGIFRKIQEAMRLPEKRFALLELAKGKFTTDPDSHTGEGIFFSSKIAELFFISSDELTFCGRNAEEDCATGGVSILSEARAERNGTTVGFEILLEHALSNNDVFFAYTEHPEHYGFTKTLVPVRLLEYGEPNPIFVSRSQAKRLLARFDRFKYIALDFEGVREIGQGFADEVFRVFRNAHPDCVIVPVNADQNVERMIRHVTEAH